MPAIAAIAAPTMIAAEHRRPYGPTEQHCQAAKHIGAEAKESGMTERDQAAKRKQIETHCKDGKNCDLGHKLMSEGADHEIAHDRARDDRGGDQCGARDCLTSAMFRYEIARPATSRAGERRER